MQKHMISSRTDQEFMVSNRIQALESSVHQISDECNVIAQRLQTEGLSPEERIRLIEAHGAKYAKLLQLKESIECLRLLGGDA